MITVATDMSETQTAHRLQIEIWSDIACPWCFIGKRRLEEALAQFPHRDRVDITWRSFQLDPQLPARFDGSESDYLHLLSRHPSTAGAGHVRPHHSPGAHGRSAL